MNNGQLNRTRYDAGVLGGVQETKPFREALNVSFLNIPHPCTDSDVL